MLPLLFVTGIFICLCFLSIMIVGIAKGSSSSASPPSSDLSSSPSPPSSDLFPPSSGPSQRPCNDCLITDGLYAYKPVKFSIKISENYIVWQFFRWIILVDDKIQDPDMLKAWKLFRDIYELGYVLIGKCDLISTELSIRFDINQPNDQLPRIILNPIGIPYMVDGKSNPLLAKRNLTSSINFTVTNWTYEYPEIRMLGGKPLPLESFDLSNQPSIVKNIVAKSIGNNWVHKKFHNIWGVFTKGSRRVKLTFADIKEMEVVDQRSIDEISSAFKNQFNCEMRNLSYSMKMYITFIRFLDSQKKVYVNRSVISNVEDSLFEEATSITISLDQEMPISGRWKVYIASVPAQSRTCFDDLQCIDKWKDPNDDSYVCS